MSNKQKVTSNEQKVKRNKRKVTSNEQKVTSNEQKVRPLILLRKTIVSSKSVKSVSLPLLSTVRFKS